MRCFSGGRHCATDQIDNDGPRRALLLNLGFLLQLEAESLPDRAVEHPEQHAPADAAAEKEAGRSSRRNGDGARVQFTRGHPSHFGAEPLVFVFVQALGVLHAFLCPAQEATEPVKIYAAPQLFPSLPRPHPGDLLRYAWKRVRFQSLVHAAHVHRLPGSASVHPSCRWLHQQAEHRRSELSHSDGTSVPCVTCATTWAT